MVLLDRGGGEKGLERVEWGNWHRKQVQVFSQLLHLKAQAHMRTHMHSDLTTVL